MKKIWLISLLVFSCGDFQIQDLQNHPFITFFEHQLITIDEWQIPEFEEEISCSSLLPKNYEQMTCEEIILTIDSPLQAYNYIKEIENHADFQLVSDGYYINFCDFHTSGSKTLHDGSKELYVAALLSDNGIMPILLIIYYDTGAGNIFDPQISADYNFIFKKNRGIFDSGDEYCINHTGSDSIEDYIMSQTSKKNYELLGYDIIYIPANFPNYLTQDYNLKAKKPAFSHTF